MRSLHRLCEASDSAFDTSEVYDWIRAAHAPAFRSNCEAVVVIVGHGPTHLPMDWLYAYEFPTWPRWDRDWLLDRVEEAIPLAGGKPVAHDVDIRQNYLWDGTDFTHHSVTVRLTDTLVRRELRSTAVEMIRDLFLELRDLEDTELSGFTRPASMIAAGVALAYEHLKAEQLSPDPCPAHSPTSSSVIGTNRGAVHVASPAFAHIPGSIVVSREGA